MFDMLDDDLDDIGYVPTMMANSRSGNMKKITKKQPKAPAKQPSTKAINNKSNDYDDLLDDIMDFDLKKPAKPQQNKPAPPKQNMFNSFDSQTQDPKPKSVEKQKPIIKQSQPISSNTSKNAFLKFDNADEIIQQDLNFSSFGKSQPAFNNPIKSEQPFVSSRNMKPPISKKKNDQSQNLSFGAASIGLSMPGQNISKNLSLNNEEDEIIRPPPRLMNRRSSVDNKSEKNDETLSLPKDNRDQSSLNKFSLENKKEQPPKQRQQLRLSFDEPKIQSNVSHKSQQVSSFKVKFQQKQKEVKPVQKIEPLKQQKPIIKEEKLKKGLDMQIDQSITILKESPGPNSHINNRQTMQQYEKQIEQIKITFQKQVDFLQQNLDKQITVNRQTRDRLMRESNKMIEQERSRTNKIQEQQTKRLKEMFQWQKRRMEESYQIQIDNLKKNLEYAQKTNNYTFKPSQASREDIQYLQAQLKHQKKLMDDRQKILQKRQLQLSQRQAQMNKRRKLQQKRLRQQQKRILQSQMKMKKQFLEEKRLLNQQKQQRAIELANLQIQAMKKKQKADYSLKQNRIAKQGLENERFQLRNQNAELIARYKAKVEEVESQRIRLKLIQADLIKKLRIVQQKFKQSNNTSAVNKTMYTKKENNWIDDRDKSHQHMRSFSIEKHQPVSKQIPTNQTKDRFYQLQSNTKSKMNISAKENKKFDLDNYMLTVEEYKKMKGQF